MFCLAPAEGKWSDRMIDCGGCGVNNNYNYSTVNGACRINVLYSTVTVKSHCRAAGGNTVDQKKKKFCPSKLSPDVQYCTACMSKFPLFTIYSKLFFFESFPTHHLLLWLSMTYS